MKLFISYSHDDKAWTYELWRALRDRADHDTWIDQRLIPAQDWWDTILTKIEEAEAIVYILSPKSIESIYCLAEMDYALVLNKPIIPLMLKSCTSPDKLRRVQHKTIDNQMSLDAVLLIIERGLNDINRARWQEGKYTPPNPLPPHPDEPKPARKHVAETFTLAEEAYTENNLTLAEQKFQQVIDADPNGYGLAAKERLKEIWLERERDTEYQHIVQMMGNPALHKGARALWKVFVGKHGADYDPQGIAVQFIDKAKHIRVYDILPPPFEWIEIPAGKVILIPDEIDKEDSYLKQDTIFDVPSFAVFKYPVTNAQFAEFVGAGGYTEKRWWTEAGWRERGNRGWTEPRYWRDVRWNGTEQPVVGVSWYECVAFCLWLSQITGEKITLPTEQQWQRAAQGNDGRLYPWGNEWDSTRCNNSVSSHDSKQTTFVHQYEGFGNSPFGVVDLAGNVREWCLTSYDNGSNTNNKTGKRVMRGGSWRDFNKGYFRVDIRDGDYPDFRFTYWGFRCARST